jgi:hypothetical protein
VGLVKIWIAAALVAVALAAAGPAGAEDTGTVVLRLTTDPTPARTTWTYDGLPAAVRLGTGVTSRKQDVRAGSYTVTEHPAAADAPATLTGLACSDPTRDSRAKVSMGVATIAVAAGETVTCTFTHRALGPVPAASAQELARQFAPELRLASGEHYHPLAIPDYLSTAWLYSGSPPHGTLRQLNPTLFTLPVGLGASYLDVHGAEPSSSAAAYPLIEARLEEVHERPTVYWRLVRQASTGRIAIEYWLLYLYNDFTDRHEADWEGVTVVLDNGTPIGATYSQHQGRKWASWGAAPADAGPIVYVAKGSHANYPAAGKPRVPVCWTIAGGRHCTGTRKTDSAVGDGRSLGPDDYDLHELGGVGFTGSWGSGTFVLGVGRTRDRIVDPRRRSDYSNPFASVPAS